MKTMSDKKRFKLSREEIARLRNAIIEDVSEEDTSDAPEGDAELLYRSLSRLRTVRVPGKGELSTDEAIKAAREQGETYKRWCESGTPTGDIDVWVDGFDVPLTSVKRPFRLGDINVKVQAANIPSLDSAVLQLTTQANGEQVVLCNLRLGDVPPEGLTHTEWWPNGEHISLSISCAMRAAASAGAGAGGFSPRAGGVSEFCVSISANPHPVETNSFFEEEATHRHGAAATIDGGGGAAADTGKSRAKSAGMKTSIVKMLRHLVIPLRFSITNLAYTAALVMLVLSLVRTGALSRRGEVSKPAASASTYNIETSLSAGLSSLEYAYVSEPTTASQPPSFVLSSASAWEGEEASDGYYKTPDQGRKSGVAGKSSRVSQRHLLAGSNPLEIKRLAKIAALPHVSVRLDSTQVTPATEAVGLHASFTRALESSKRFKVLEESDQAPVDAVIGLRFEPDEAFSGVVFVDVRSLDGKFIWQDFTDCRTFPNSDQNTMFSAAAESLVSDLEKIISLSQQSTKQVEILSGGE